MLIICGISFRFAEENAQSINYYIILRDSVVDFEADYPKLVSSSRAINKIAKAVCNNFEIYLVSLSAYTYIYVDSDAYSRFRRPRRRYRKLELFWLEIHCPGTAKQAIGARYPP